MEDALKLQGYLMKEKSKFSRLHGLTGDINKRYFRIRNIEGSEELALCYYKNSADPEVRGWIYLTDVTEIAERQDTIILTSASRTLHLYAQTRAQHSAWVTGLATLCPDAFTMLGRDVLKAVDDIPPTSSAPTSSNTTKPIDTPLADDHDQLPKDAPAAGGLVLSDEPQVSTNTVDEEESSPSINEKDAPAELFQTPRENDQRLRRHRGKHLDKSTGGHREPGERRESWRTPRSDSHNVTSRKDQQSDHHVGLAGDERGTKDRYHRQRSSLCGTRRQHSSSEVVKRGEVDDKGQTCYRTEGQPGRRHKGSENQSARKADNFDEQDSVMETAASPTSNCKSADDADNLVDKRSATKNQPQGCQRGLQARDTNRNDRGNAAENQDMKQPEQRDATSVKEAGVDTDGDKGAGVRSEANGDHSTNQSRGCSSDNENVETIELGEVARYNDTHTRLGLRKNRAIGQVQQQADGPTPADVLKGSNQDEIFDEEAEIDLALPRLEIGDWGGPHQEQLATSRLHRHISRSDTEAMGLNGSVPPPKEFLKNTPLKPTVNRQREEGGCLSNGGQGRDPENTSLVDVPKSVPKGRRRSAADLEWSDGGETPDRPRGLENKLIQSTDCRPVDLGDSEDDGEDSLDLDIEKQRRRAAAAVLALEAAAKEADEGAQVESEALDDCKRSSNDGTKRVVAKACPSPAGPPPPELVRKARRGHGVPPLGVAPPKAVPPARVKAANRRTDADANFVGEDWDDETKTTCHGASVGGVRGTGGLPETVVGASGTLLMPAAGQNHDNHWIHFDD